MFKTHLTMVNEKITLLVLYTMITEGFVKTTMFLFFACEASKRTVLPCTVALEWDAESRRHVMVISASEDHLVLTW